MRGRLHGALVALLVLAAGTASFLHAREPLEAARRRLDARQTPLYFPSPKTVRLLSVGHRTTLADALYIWSIQYFGDPSQDMPDRRGWLWSVYDTITELDPLFRDAYWLGYISLLVEARSPEFAFRMADKALKNDPAFTWMAIEAAMTARHMKNEALTIKYLQIGSESGDVLAIRFLTKLRITDVAQQELEAWEDLLDSDDELTRAIAATHVRDLRVFIDCAVLEALIRCYKAERGMAPGNLEQLVAAGYVAEIPLDPEGRPYLHDPRTLSVRSETPYRHVPPSRARYGADLSGLGRCRPPGPAQPPAPPPP